MSLHDAESPRRVTPSLPESHPRGLLRLACSLGMAGTVLLGGCTPARERVVVRPYKVEVPVVACAPVRPEYLEDITPPPPPDPMTYGALVEWTADLLELVERLRADRAAVRAALPARCAGGAP